MAVQNAFTLLGLPVRFALPEETLDAQWQKAMLLVHPDRFAGRSEAEKRVAEQWAGRINDARNVLANPVTRAEEILRIAGVELNAETDTRMPADFLMQQMLWRERAEDAAEREALAKEISDAFHHECLVLLDALDVNQDYPKAREAARRLLFIERIAQQIQVPLK